MYGKKSSSKKTTTELPNTVFNDLELCSTNSIDTIFTDAKQNTYVFKKDKYWKLTEDGIAAGYPKSISKSWPGLPSNIDAAFTYKNGKTYFFKVSLNKYDLGSNGHKTNKSLLYDFDGTM